MPTITDLRCRACTVKGGTIVATLAEAEALSEIPYVRIAIAERRMPAIQVGDAVSLRPCENKPGDYAPLVKEHAEGKRDWPCPLVELRTENAEAADLFYLATNEETRGYAGIYAESLLADYPEDERARIMRRALRALGDGRILEARQALRQKAIEEARMKARRK